MHRTPSMPQPLRWTSLAAALVVTLGLNACNKTEERTTGQRVDEAISKTEQAAQEAKQKAVTAAGEVSDATRRAASDAAALVDDAAITTKVKAGLAQDMDLSALKIDVGTSAGVVTLSGPVKSEQARERAGQIAQGVSGVSSVVNKLTVSSGS
ncbi:MAG: BON domain-containing protein [Proteobacteria bacterium]|nr:BON domain-containing protein [Pseudomonadota bacterium]